MTASAEVVSVLQVADPVLWAELEAIVPLDAHVTEVIDDRRRVVDAAFERELLPELRGRVLVRYARRDPGERSETVAHLVEEVASLRAEHRRVLAAAQRHALDDVVIGRHAWDPVHDAPAVRALHGLGLITAVPEQDAAPYEGRYRLHPDLPPPPPVPYDFTEAVMDETDDLSTAGPGVLGLLHDMASLAAALTHDDTRVTHAGTVTVADARKLGRRLADDGLATAGALETHPRWSRALRGLHALHVVTLDPLARVLHLDLGLEATLAGTTEEATDRLVHKLVDRDLHVVVPAIRAALAQAGPGAVDELVFLELLRDQHRDVLIPPWERDGERVYPALEGEPHRPYDDDGFEVVETRMIHAVLARLQRTGLLRRAPGVFAATPDGRRWAAASTTPLPPVWVTGDLEVIVPPDAVTPWERFQLERLGRCQQRDVVDRYRLERADLEAWLAWHDVDEALALLERRCPAVPPTVRETLTSWATSALRIVLTRGVRRA
ncbi:MAG: hypothetical protein H6733_03590 [Alphaproteobacteria bacterium]|nr:hypothetical protein [Alphaproteobacteria bacterium]